MHRALFWSRCFRPRLRGCGGGRAERAGPGWAELGRAEPGWTAQLSSARLPPVPHCSCPVGDAGRLAWPRHGTRRDNRQLLGGIPLLPAVEGGMGDAAFSLPSCFCVNLCFCVRSRFVCNKKHMCTRFGGFRVCIIHSQKV